MSPEPAPPVIEHLRDQIALERALALAETLAYAQWVLERAERLLAQDRAHPP